MARAGLLLLLLLAGCATSNPYGVQDKDATATVQGTSSLEGWIPLMNSGVTIQAVDSQALKMDESQVVLPPGPHSFVVSCSIDGQNGAHYAGQQEISLNLVAGHSYKFVTEDPSAGSTSDGGAALLQALVHTVAPGDRDLLSTGASDRCESFAYDRSYDKNAYPAIVALAPPVDADDWKERRTGQRAGYQWRQLYDSDVDDGAAKESVDSEYWSRLMFTDDVHARYQERLAKARKDCDQASISVIADTPAGLDYELDMPGCLDKPPVELGRFLSDDYGIHRVAVMFKAAPSAADRQAWLKALDAATIETL